MATVFSPLHLVQRGIQDFVNISIEGKKIGVISIIWMECHLVIRVQLINVDLLPLWRNGKEKEERGDYEKETFASSQNLPQWSPDQWFQEWIYHTTKSHHDSTNSTSSHQGAETALVAHFSSVFFDTPMCFICDFASFLTLSCSFARRMVVNDKKVTWVAAAEGGLSRSGSEWFSQKVDKIWGQKIDTPLTRFEDKVLGVVHKWRHRQT